LIDKAKEIGCWKGWDFIHHGGRSVRFEPPTGAADLSESQRVQWVRGHAQEFGGDADRLVLSGHSAGAYNAAMLALNPRFLGTDRKAVLGLIGLAGPYDFLPFDGPVVQQAFGVIGDPVETQPVHYVGPGNPPAFLATGDKDEMVRPANSDSLASKLDAVGVQVERRRYPEVGHAGLVTAIAKPLRGRADRHGRLCRSGHQITSVEIQLSLSFG